MELKFGRLENLTPHDVKISTADDTFPNSPRSLS